MAWRNIAFKSEHHHPWRTVDCVPVDQTQHLAAELELEAPVTHEENPAGYWRLAESQLPKCRDQKI